jgi:nanoRNase/pAp phosphatase (c-di-AMP/oligoRNAs hydrolase)
MKIDWVRKLTSRKLWAAVASFVSLLLVAFGVSDSTAAQIVAIIMAGATVIAYIIGEGLVDAASVNDESNDESKKEGQ